MIKFFKKLLNLWPAEEPRSITGLSEEEPKSITGLSETVQPHENDVVLTQDSMAEAKKEVPLKVLQYTTYAPNWDKICNFKQLKELFMQANLTFIVEDSSSDAEKFKGLANRGLIKKQDFEQNEKE